LPTYQFLYGYPKFYPAVQDAEGKSLTANPGDVVEFDTPPNDGCWFPVDLPAGPEPAPEPVTPEPQPEPAPVVSEPAEPVSPPVAEPPAEGPAPFTFPGFHSA